MRSRALAFIACTVLLATSCTRDAETGAAAGTDGTGAAANGRNDAAGASGPRAATRVDTIAIEGTPTPMPLSLVESPASFPLQFSTYRTDDMQVELVADSAAVKFVAAFGGTVQPKAFVHVQRLAAAGSAGAVSEPAASMIARMLVDHPISEMELLEGAPPWASDGAGFSYTEGGVRYNGTVAVRTEGTTPIRITIHMPSEYGDGMSPRVQVILENWRWADGKPLIP